MEESSGPSVLDNLENLKPDAATSGTSSEKDPPKPANEAAQ